MGIQSLKDYDWRKHASAVANNDQIEKAFADQAFSFVAQKASKICTRPYLLGFEMIYANEDKSRLVGIFGFKIDNSLYYAPVFFLNGIIKGNLLLWRVDKKKFVPLEEDWIDYLLEKNAAEDGRSINKTRTDSLQTGVSLDPMIYPRRYKTASAESLPRFLSSSQKNNPTWVANFMDAFSPKVASFAPTGLISKFIAEDGGVMAYDAIAGAVKSSYAFAEALMHSINDVTDLMVYPAVKKASGPSRKHTLSIRTGNIKAASTQSELNQLIKLGYIFDDRRHDEEINQIYLDTEHNLENMQTPGVYAVIKKDGTKTTVLMAGAQSTCKCSNNKASGMPVSVRNPVSSASGKKAYIYLDEKNAVCFCSLDAGSEGCMGTPLPDEEMIIGRAVVDSPVVGKTYLLIMPKDKVVSDRAFKVVGKEQKETGTTCIETNEVWEYGSSEHICELIVNPNSPRSCWAEGILGKDTKFIEVPVKEDGKNYKNEPYYKLAEAPTLLSVKEMMDTLMSSGLRKFTLEGVDDGIEIQTGNKLRRFMTDDNDAGTTKAAAFLAADLGIKAEAVNALLIKAQNKKVSFFIEPKNVKMALGLTRVIDRADFTPSYDSYFNTAIEVPKEYALRTETKGPQIREIPLNEVYDPSHGNGGNKNSLSAEDLLKNEPEKLKELADSKNLPFVFEHGLVGSLVKTFDASALIDKYLPNMEEALDSIGRMIFLFYWKPKDFENSIGQDDMTDMESELTSNFKSLGALTLNLLKKSKQVEGTLALQ
jgi:hypothetical protein